MWAKELTTGGLMWIDWTILYKRNGVIIGSPYNSITGIRQDLPEFISVAKNLWLRGREVAMMFRLAGNSRPIWQGPGIEWDTHKTKTEVHE